jgi:hypothetical protein
MNKFLRFVPTIFYILFTTLWFVQEYVGLGTYNLPCIAIGIALVAQLFTNNKTTGFLYGIIFLIFSGYEIITSITAHIETEIVTDNTAKFYTMQYVIFGVCFIMAVGMVYYNRYYSHKPA